MSVLNMLLMFCSDHETNQLFWIYFVSNAFSTIRQLSERGVNFNTTI